MKKSNSLKSLFAVAAIVIAFLIFSFNKASAQSMAAGMKDKTPPERAQMQTTFMINKLALDSVQTVKVQEINLKYAEKMDPILKGTGRKFKEMREIKSIQKSKDDDLKKVFTADQYKQYQVAEAEMREKMKEAMSGN